MASLEKVQEQLQFLNKEQANTTDSIMALHNTFMLRFKMEDRNKLDELEALKEASGKGSGGAQARADKAKNKGKGFNLAFNPLDMLRGAALPALVALGASLTGFDDAIKALKIPDYLSSIRTSLKSVASTFELMKTRATKLVDSVKKIKLPEIDLKFPKMPDFKLVDKDGKPFKFPKFEVPDTLKNLKFPNLEGVKAFFVGTEAGGGVFGFFNGLVDMVGKIPGAATIARLVGGPVTQAIVSIIDFFQGFYKGFTEVEYDKDGNAITKSFGERMMAGLEGGVDGVLKAVSYTHLRAHET